MNALTGYIVLALLGTSILGGGAFYIEHLRLTNAEMAGKLAATEQARDTAVQANKDQQQAINDLKDAIQTNTEIRNTLQSDVEARQKQSVQMDEALAKLEKANADVRTFLDAAVPPDLQCLLANDPAAPSCRKH